MRITPLKVSTQRGIALCDPNLSREVERLSGVQISHCNQCAKCTAGCPVAFAMDRPPHQVIRLVQLGLRDEALRSQASWICLSCETCATRCPREIDPPRVMDALHVLGMAAGVPAGEPQMLTFQRLFLDSVRRHGRLQEIPLMTWYTVRSLWHRARTLRLRVADIKGLIRLGLLGFNMFRRGKLKLVGGRISDRRSVARIFRAADRDSKGQA